MGRGQWSTPGRGLGPQSREAGHSTPGHIGLEEYSVSKGSIGFHTKCDIKSDLESEKRETVKRLEETTQMSIN